MPRQNCRNCKFCKDWFDRPISELDEYDTAECIWEPAVLPYSWRYCETEVMSVQLNDGENCPCFEQRK